MTSSWRRTLISRSIAYRAGTRAGRDGILGTADDDTLDGDGIWTTSLYTAAQQAQGLIPAGKNVGDPAVVTTHPDTAYVQITNTCKTSASPRAFPAISRAIGTNKVSVSGGIYVKSGPGIHRIPIHQPALYLGTVFATAEQIVRFCFSRRK